MPTPRRVWISKRFMASSTPSDYRDGACTQPARVDAGPNFPQKIWPGERPASGRQTFRNQGVRLSGTHNKDHLLSMAASNRVIPAVCRASGSS
jgi:hypothetical protein